MKRENTKIKISYYTTKYLDSLSETRSINKIEKIINSNIDSEKKLAVATVIFSYHNDKNINPLKHPNLFEYLLEYKKFIRECNLKFKDSLFNYDEDFANKNIDESIVNAITELNDMLSFKNRNRDIKEVTRVAAEKIIKTYKISLSTISEKLNKKKVDTSNLHKFIVKKDYSKVSMETVEELNEIVKELNEYMENNSDNKKEDKNEKNNK